MHWLYLSRRPQHPLHAHSRAAPSPGKGTSTLGTPFHRSSVHPARWALIPDLTEQISRHRGLLHSPAACTPRGHRPGPSRHHRWCPRSPGQGSPLSRCRNRCRPPGGAVCCLRKEKCDNEVLMQAWRSGLWRSGMGRWGWEESSCPASPLRLQSLLVETWSFCIWASSWVWFLTAAMRVIRLKIGQNRKYHYWVMWDRFCYPSLSILTFWFLEFCIVVVESPSHVWLSCDHMDSSLPGFSVRGISQARIQE